MCSKIFEYILVKKSKKKNCNSSKISDIFKQRNGEDLDRFCAVIGAEDETGFV